MRVLSIKEQVDLAWSTGFMTFGQRKADLRVRLAEAQNWRCVYCHTPMSCDGIPEEQPTIERVVPPSRRPDLRFDPDNLVAACWACNAARGDQVWPVHREAFAVMGISL